MADSLNGKWSYRSFRNELIEVSNGELVGTPQLAVPWAPPGELEVSTDKNETISGTLTFRPGVTLTVQGKLISATDKLPAGVDLMGEGLSAVYKIRGQFIPGSDHVVGTVICLTNDLGKQPDGTWGWFVLFPVTQ